MFNLTEAFREQYEVYLEEKLNEDFQETFRVLNESQQEADKAFRTLQKYFHLYSLAEDFEYYDDTKENPKKENKQQIKKDEKLSGDVLDVIKQALNVAATGAGNQYKPEAAFQTVKKVSQMKFPENIIFFVNSLISWITNVIKRFISFFSNVLRSLVGLDKAEDKFNSDDLKIKLRDVKRVEATVVPMSSAMSKTPGYMTSYEVPSDQLEILKVLNDNYEPVSMGENLNEYTDTKKNTEQNTIQVLSIDVSKDMENLFQLLQHFLDLFDNAYGSNGEHLFEISDLQLLLGMFQSTIKDISSGTVSTYALSGKLTNLDMLDSGKLRDSLIRTKVNIDNLKTVYTQTESRITSTLTMIQRSQIVASAKLGQTYKFYSASTYTGMIKILDVINPRIKDAVKLEKNLAKMSKVFDSLVKQLGAQRQSLRGFGSVAYTSVYQKKIDELFNSARFVSQTTTLRLTSLGLYIKQLRDIREAVTAANAINAGAKSVVKSLKFKF